MSEVEYRLIEGVPGEEELAWVVEVSQSIFAQDESIAAFQKVLTGRRRILTCVAFDDGTPVGFKMGFEERPHYFESWRGGARCA